MSRCILCDEPLKKAEQQTCHSCTVRAGELLSGIVTMWTELPAHRGHLRSITYGGGSPDVRIPGGDVLVLAGPGANGGEARRLTPREQRRPERWWLLGGHGPLTLRAYLAVERERTGREHHSDNRPTDTPSVAQVLTGWASDWSGDDTRWTVPAAASFLARRTTWAARELDVFSDYVRDLEQLHARLERATGRAVDIVRANIDCLACGRALIKQLDDTGRQAEDFTCEGCGRVYTEQRYRLALSAELQRQNEVTVDGVDYATPTLVAGLLGRPVATVRAWERHGLIRRLVHRGVLLVAEPDARREHEARPTRERKAS